MSLDQSAERQVRDGLLSTRFEAKRLEKITGGSVNWVFLATLAKPLDDGTTQVLVKHGEKRMASKPDFELPLFRCDIEAESLRVLSGEPLGGASKILVRTPKLLGLHRHEDHTDEIQEFLPNGIDMKQYFLKHFSGDPTPVQHTQARELGRAVGRWYAGFIAWSSARGRDDKHYAVVAQSAFGQEIKHMVNFAWLKDRVEEFPGVLGGIADVLAEVEQMHVRERRDEDGRYQIIHGDFWTGNIILPDAPLDANADVPVFVVDWESSQLGLPSSDFGQMLAEMYALWLYKGIELAQSLIDGFVEAYREDGGRIDDDFSFRSLIQVGAHIICTTTTFPGWGTREKVEEVAGVGKDIIVHAWERDRAWFEEGDLRVLFT
ncbi:hypothetical protein CPLU01_11693 [Colletotrichum plurivorum]|uniref:Aminoglycoside phosphotransferase domain-containing protein n=1 Tax=Colletotrichum plurivorum TaxID=2175906 RepID=A0A8H6K1E5_9PEZI|nr:hypothetical protein CPLU01_11693 [Colletotrichum plurivorum]